MSRIYMLLCSSLFIISGLSAQVFTWTGTGGDDSWFNASNWDLNAIPTSTDDAIIPDGATPEIITNPAFIANINLFGSATLTLSNNLTITQELNIAEDATLHWTQDMISGGGTIQNNGTFLLTSNEDKVFENTTLNNDNKVEIREINFLRLENNPVINNSELATFEIHGNAGLVHNTGTPVFNNFGLVKKYYNGTSQSFSYMIFEMNNFGIIDIEQDETYLFLNMQATLNNMPSGVIQGHGIYDITAHYTNNGTIFPGDDGTVGRLDVTNNFHFPPSATAKFDINGTAPNEADLIAITGFPTLEGQIIANLGYAPQLGDEITIITAWDITSCNLPNTITASYQGNTYTFLVVCSDINVKLRAIEILDVDDFAFGNNSFLIQPNPVANSTTFKFPSEVFGHSEEKLSIAIYNYAGQEVETIANISEENYKYNRGTLASGLYFVQLKTPNNVLGIQKMILE